MEGLPTDLNLLLEAVSGVMGEEFAEHLDSRVWRWADEDYR